MRDQAACWQEHLRPALAGVGVTFLEQAQYTDKIRRYLASYFKTDVFPLLTPLAFDPGHPFPRISNRSKNFTVAVRHNRRTKFVLRSGVVPFLVAVETRHQRLDGRTAGQAPRADEAEPELN